MLDTCPSGCEVETASNDQRVTVVEAVDGTTHDFRESRLLGGPRNERQKILGMGKDPEHCPGAAHLVVSATCSPPRTATSADQLALAMVGQ